MRPRLGIQPREGGFPAAEPPPRIRGSEDRTGRGRGLFCASTAPRFREVCPRGDPDLGMLRRNGAYQPRIGDPGHGARATPAPSPAPGASGPLVHCAAPLPLGSLSGSVRSSARLGPGPSLGPRVPHASLLAGTAPQMRLREEEPRGPAPQEQERRGGGGRRGDARGGGGRAAALKTRRGSGHWPGWGAPYPAPTHIHTPATRGRGSVSVASYAWSRAGRALRDPRLDAQRVWATGTRSHSTGCGSVETWNPRLQRWSAGTFVDDGRPVEKEN